MTARADSAPSALHSTRLLILAGRLDAIRQGIASDYDQAFAAGGLTLKAELRPQQRALDGQLGQVLALVQKFSEQGISPADQQVFGTTYGQSLDALNLAWGASSHLLGTLLQARVDSLFHKMWLHLGTALALLFAILGLVFTVARLIAAAQAARGRGQ